MNKVYLITNVEEYGKLMAYCVNNDISVWRTYWDEREKGKRCYHINYKEKRCYYSTIEHYINDFGYYVVIPKFSVNKYGDYTIESERDIDCYENVKAISTNYNNDCDDKCNNNNCTLGEILDHIADSHYAKGLDSYTAYMLAIQELTKYIITIHKKAYEALHNFVQRSNKND